jgi:Cys-rich protein (TIGR01571 family)
MKTLSILSAFALLGSAVAASARSKKAASFNWAGTEVADAGPEDSLLEVSEENKASAQRRALLAELQVRERAAEQAKRTLEAEQKSLVAAQQVQQLLEAHLTKLEASEEEPTPGAASHVVGGEMTKSKAEQSSMHKVDEKAARSITAQVTQAFKTELVMMASGVEVIVPGIIQATSINVTQTEQQYWNEQNKAFYTNVSGIAVYILFMLIAGAIYVQVMEKSVGSKVPEHMIRVDEFQYGAFECSECDRDWQICLCSWCFEWVRWADTASHPQLEFIGFWPALAITTLLAAAATITFGATVPILLLIVVFCRQRIRVAYGLPRGTFMLLAGDCCLWMWCPCCAIIQEARQVEYVTSRLVKADGIPAFGPGQPAPVASQRFTFGP